MKKKHSYVFVIGGVMSGIGKGIVSASLGNIMQARGFRANLVKADPYLNVDAGTMNPTEHGEVFVMESGLETDQDMGTYERFLNLSGQSIDYMTSGMVYSSVIARERALGYGGKCVEAIPHIVDEITERITQAERENRSDITLVEIGGTIGDYQNIMFIEAARVLKLTRPEDVAIVLVGYLPMPQHMGEMKTRPTRIAAQALNSHGVNADLLIARSAVAMDDKRRAKLALACNLAPARVVSLPDVKNIYGIPLELHKQGVDGELGKILHLKLGDARFGAWETFVKKGNAKKAELSIAVVGKYFDSGDFTLADAYVSVIEAMRYSAYAVNRTPKLTWISAREFEGKGSKVSMLAKFDGVIVPGGFGSSGIEGKLNAIRYAREHGIPYFGLCYGMQLMVIEYARHVVHLKDAHTTEVAPKTKHPVIDILPEQKALLKDKRYGASMRLGAYPAHIKKGTHAASAYGTSTIIERHRHRYEVNPEYVQQLTDAGIVFSGTSPDGILMEIAELPKKVHPFFVGAQFHPEFLARPLAPHPLFTAFAKAASKHGQKNKKR
jgi:CTP synthase